MRRFMPVGTAVAGLGGEGSFGDAGQMANLHQSPLFGRYRGTHCTAGQVVQDWQPNCPIWDRVGPSGVLWLAPDGDVGAGGAREIARELARCGEVLCGVAAPFAGPVRVKADVQRPVQAGLDAPGGAHGGGKRLGRAPGRGRKIPSHCAGRAARVTVASTMPMLAGPGMAAASGWRRDVSPENSSRFGQTPSCLAGRSAGGSAPVCVAAADPTGRRLACQAVPEADVRRCRSSAASRPSTPLGPRTSRA